MQNVYVMNNVCKQLHFGTFEIQFITLYFVRQS